MNTKEAFTWLGFVVNMAAAILWFISTRVKFSYDKSVTEYQKIHGPDSAPGGIIGGDGSDFCATVQRQALWSAWAALTTGLGVALSAIGSIIAN
jgi:hypothetical protein